MRKGCILVVFGLLFMAVGIGVTIWAAVTLRRASASTDWPTTEGKVISSEVESHKGGEGGTTYGAEVLYEYSVSRTTHSGNKVSFGDYSSSNPGHAREIVNKYPADETVTVHYNPERPEVAVLEPGGSSIIYLPLGFGLVCCVVGFFAVVGSGFAVLRGG